MINFTVNKNYVHELEHSFRYTVCHPLNREVLFCFGYEILVTNWAAHCTVCSCSISTVEHVKVY